MEKSVREVLPEPELDSQTWPPHRVIGAVFWLVGGVFYLGGMTALVWAAARGTVPAVIARSVIDHPGASLSVLVVALALALVGYGLADSRWLRIPIRYAVPSLLLATTLILGIASYATCQRGDLRFWFATVRTFELFVGSGVDPFGIDPACPAAAPVAMLMARLAAVATVFSAVLAALMQVFQRQIDRFTVMTASRLVVVFGLNQTSLAVLRHEKRQLPPGTLLVVVNTEDQVVSHCRALGAVPFTVAADADTNLNSRLANTDRGLSIPGLTRLLVRRGRFRATRIVMIDPSPVFNIEILEQVRQIAKPHLSQVAVNAVVRIDNPLRAETWRHQQEDQTWTVAVISAYEIAAVQIADTLLTNHQPSLNPALPQGAVITDSGVSIGHKTIVIVGFSEMAVALCAEFGRRLRHGKAQENPTSEIFVAGPQAQELLNQHRPHKQSETGIRLLVGESTETAPSIPHSTETIPSGWESAIAHLLTSPTVILTKGATKTPLEAETLAMRHPSWQILHQDDATEGLSRYNVIDNLRTFGPTLDLPAA